MPNLTKNAPDLVDLQAMVGTIGESYAHAVYFSCRIRADALEVIGKTVPAPYTQATEATHVALQILPLQSRQDLTVVFYTLAFDLWLQHDGGGATAAKRGPTYDWQGRLNVPRRRTHR